MTSLDTSLITPELLEAYQAKHDAGPYGVTAFKVVERTPLKPFVGMTTVLDYGAGAQSLKQTLLLKHPELVVTSYDPAVRAIADRPVGKFDLVCCLDVLEHIEPDLINNVLDDIRSFASQRVFLHIATRYAKHHLPDGRNLHLIVESPEWWRNKVKRIGKVSATFASTTPAAVEFVIDI